MAKGLVDQSMTALPAIKRRLLDWAATLSQGQKLIAEHFISSVFDGPVVRYETQAFGLIVARSL